MKKLLITGCSGFVGSNLVRYFSDRYNVFGWYNSNSIDNDNCQKKDFTKNNIEDAIRIIDPDIVINTAAISKPDICEKQKNMSYLINVATVEKLALLSKKLNFRLVHFSTDLVYPGTKMFYSEQDDIGIPINYYAQSKLLSENAVITNASNYVILRLALTFGKGIYGKSGFQDWILKSIVNNEPVKLFTDQYRTVLYIKDLIAFIEVLIENEFNGVVNVGGKDRISRYNFGLMFAEYLGVDSNLIIPILSTSIPTLAKRPDDVSMNISKIIQVCNLTPHNISDNIRDYVAGNSFS